MTKLSQLRIDPEEDERGEWRHLGESVYVRIRRSTYHPFQRAIRRIQLERETAEKPADVDQKLTAQEREEDAVAAARGEHVLADWYGVDDEVSAPVSLNGEAKAETIGECAGDPLVIYRAGEHVYRKLEDGTYQELVPFTRDRAVAAMRDPTYVVLREFVRRWSEALGGMSISKATSILGKSRTAPTGTRATPKSPSA